MSYTNPIENEAKYLKDIIYGLNHKEDSEIMPSLFSIFFD